MSKALRIFYSWQTDLPDPQNRGLIRDALKHASSVLAKGADDGPTLQIDEATRGEPGSPNIPITIFRKITTSEIFVADITSIGHAGTRPVPNPNVAIELGFAIATLGWARILLVFNTAFGSLKTDPPFDIDRHRIQPYLCDAKTTPSGPCKTLGGHLAAGIQIIHRANPPRADSVPDTDEGTKRERDVRTLTRVLSRLPLPIIERHASALPIFVSDASFTVENVLSGITEHLGFHLYDEVAWDHLKRFITNFGATLEHGAHFSSVPGGYRRFTSYRNGSSVEPQTLRRVDDEINKNVDEMMTGLRAFLKHVRDNYVEIDVDQLIRFALEEFHGLEKEVDILLGDARSTSSPEGA